MSRRKETGLIILVCEIPQIEAREAHGPVGSAPGGGDAVLRLNGRREALVVLVEGYRSMAARLSQRPPTATQTPPPAHKPAS